jgi:single-stranded DNA-binding protein
MMPNLNLMQIIGHVGKEVESKSVGKSMVYTFSVAVSRGKNKETQEEYGTDWFRVQCWNQDWIPNVIHQGDLVYVQGRMEIDQKDEKTYTNVRAFRILKLREPMSNQQDDTQSIEEDIPEEEYLNSDAIAEGQDDQPPF